MSVAIRDLGVSYRGVPMGSAVQHLLALLDLEPIEVNLFRDARRRWDGSASLGDR